MFSIFKQKVIMKIAIVVSVILLIIAFRLSESKTYTHEEWDEECRKMFKKHGPVPEDEE